VAHYAKVENGLVTQVVVADSQDFCDTYLGGTWIQTSYNTYGGEHKLGGTPLRKNYAGIGYTYDSVLDAFYTPKPLDSWILNTNSCLWEPPVSMPTDGKNYVWDEATIAWVEAVTE
jgi:hypothetical protein